MTRLIISLFSALIGIVLLLPALLILAPLWLFCLVLNGIHSLLTKSTTSWSKIVEFEHELGWKPKPNLNVRYSDRIGDSCSIKTDSEGWPGEHSIEEADIVVYGDSFAFGYGSNLPFAYYSMANDCKIKPVGCPAYSMVPELILIKRHASRLRGKMVVWFACIENDLVENVRAYKAKLSYTMPFLRMQPETGEWEIVSEHVRTKKWLFGNERINNRMLFAHLCTPCAYSERIFSASRYLIDEAKEVCDTAGAQLVVFLIPYKLVLSEAGRNGLKKFLKNKEAFDCQYPEKKLSEICDALSVPCISGAEHLQLSDYKTRDGHWNRSGNKKVAGVLQEYYRAHIREARCEGSKARLGTDEIEGFQTANQY